MLSVGSMYVGRWPDMDELFWIPLSLLVVLMVLALWGIRQGWNLKRARWTLIPASACFTLAIALFYPAHTKMGFRHADDWEILWTWIRGASFALGLFFLVITVFLHTPGKTDPGETEPGETDPTP